MFFTLLKCSIFILIFKSSIRANPVSSPDGRDWRTLDNQYYACDSENCAGLITCNYNCDCKNKTLALGFLSPSAPLVGCFVLLGHILQTGLFIFCQDTFCSGFPLTFTADKLQCFLCWSDYISLENAVSAFICLLMLHCLHALAFFWSHSEWVYWMRGALTV